MHLDGFPIWNGVANEGTTTTVDGEGIGHFGNGYYHTDLMSAFAEARRENADDYPPIVKLVATLGVYLAEEYHSHYYAKAKRTSPRRTTTRSKTLTYWRYRRLHRRLTSGWTIRRTPSSSTAR